MTLPGDALFDDLSPFFSNSLCNSTSQSELDLYTEVSLSTPPLLLDYSLANVLYSSCYPHNKSSNHPSSFNPPHQPTVLPSVMKFDTIDSGMQIYSNDLIDSQFQHNFDLSGFDFSLPDTPEQHNFNILSSSSIQQCPTIYSIKEFRLCQPQTQSQTHLQSQDQSQSQPHLQSQSQYQISDQQSQKQKTKKYLDQSLHCSSCSSLIATAILHCTSKNTCLSKTQLNDTYEIDIECMSCQHKRTTKEHSAHPQNSVQECIPCVRAKRRRIGDDKMLVCQVCKVKVGTGGFKVLELESCVKSCGGHFKSNETVIDIKGHKSEIVCRMCFESYKFCSECGGGGSFRTGKYRPNALFEMEKKVCLLSHLRLSSAPLTTELVKEDYGTLMETLESLYYDGMFNSFSGPDYLEEPSSMFRSYDALKEFVDKEWTWMHKQLSTPQPVSVLCLSKIESPKKSIQKRLEDAKGDIMVGYLFCTFHAECGVLSCKICTMRTTTHLTLVVLQGMIVKCVDSFVDAKYMVIDCFVANKKMIGWLVKLGFSMMKRGFLDDFGECREFYKSFVIDTVKL